MSAETPQQPELTPEDRKRFREWVMYHMEMGMQSSPVSFARQALEYATLHERAAAQARIKELEDQLSVTKHDLKETQTKVIPGLIKFARNGQLEEYLIALELHLKTAQP